MSGSRRSVHVAWVGWVVALGLGVTAAGCSSGGAVDGGRAARGGSGRELPGGSQPDDSDRPHPRGGTARVGVWGEPDPSAPTLGGAGVRALVLPQMFVAGPGGRWTASLVAPGTDRTAPDRRSATVVFRRGAVWSDGAPITVDDLRRSADRRFVASVEGPTVDGRITLRFTQPIPGWRRLWSGTESVSPPRPGVWGGPFVVIEHTRGLEVVLRRNDRWYGPAGEGPFLDEVRLVLVPGDVIARQLLARGDLDAIMPPAATVRTRQLQALSRVRVDVAIRSGWWVGLVLGGEALSRERRQALVATVDRPAFVDTLLQQEASVLNGFGSASDRTWAQVQVGDAGLLKGPPVDLVGQIEEPMTSLLQRSMLTRARAAGATVELRNAEADEVERWLADGSYQGAVVMQIDGPVVCWTCRWGSVDEGLAHAADAGDAAAVSALENKLRDEALLLPLWRPRAVVAWRDGLNGVRANGYALNAAWNAAEWWRGSAVQ